jgi:beta-galactosidase
LGDRFLDGKTHSKVGLLFDWENWWALELSSGPTKDMDYLEQVHTYYKAFYEQNVSVDILKYSSDFSAYTVIVAPLLYMMKSDLNDRGKPGLSDRLKAFVKDGGTLIATYMSGLVDENDRCIFGAYPGELSDVLGIWVEETDALFPEEQNVICIEESADAFGQLAGEYTCGFLCDVIHPKTAHVIGTYKHDFYSGMPCITENAFGDGTAYYFGTAPEQSLLNGFVRGLRGKPDLHCGIESDPNVEIRKRVNRHGETTFIINHNTTRASVDFGQTIYRNLLNDEMVTGKHRLEVRDVLLLEQ